MVKDALGYVDEKKVADLTMEIDQHPEPYGR